MAETERHVAETTQQTRQRYGLITEKALEQRCDDYLPLQTEIGRAARYSLMGGGKRVRATLVLASCELAGVQAQAASDYAAAVEMLHCYSLIHDDLPCMDNDDLRRGRPSCHKQYPEHIALLAADALVTAAFETIANSPLSPESRVKAAAVLAKAGGARGMLYGQELDKSYEGHCADKEQLLALHQHKTGALIVAAVQLGALAAESDDALTHALEAYAAELGLTFQIVDDVLDATSDTKTLGKPVGSDAKQNKTTFVSLFGLENARQMAAQHTQAACDALKGVMGNTTFLRDLAQQLLQRNQ